MLKGTLIDLFISWKKELNASYFPQKKLQALADTLQKCLLNETILLKTDKSWITFEEVSHFGSLTLATTVWKDIISDPNNHTTPVSAQLPPRENNQEDSPLSSLTMIGNSNTHLLNEPLMCHSLAASSTFFHDYTQRMDNWSHKFILLGCTKDDLAYLIKTGFVIDYATLYQSFSLSINMSFSTRCKLLLLSGNPYAIHCALENFDERRNHSNLEILSLIARSGSVSAILYAIDKLGVTEINPTLLLQASLSNNSRLFKFLQHVYKIPISTSDEHGWNLIHYAAHQGNLKKLNYFRAEGCRISLTMRHEHPIHIAAKAGHLPVIMKLATDKLILTKTVKDKTILLLAAENGHLPVITYLEQLKCFDKLKASKDIHGSDLLHYACRSNNVNLVHYVINQLGFDINQTNLYGNNAFHFAASHGNFDILMLLENIDPAAVTSIDGARNTALFLGTTSDKKDVIFYLIALGLDPNARNLRGNTPLHMAAFYGRTNAIMALLEKNAHREAVNAQNQTPLTFALTNKDLSQAMKENVRHILNSYGLEKGDDPSPTMRFD